MSFPFGRTVFRLRALMIPDPYNPDELIPGDWNDPEVLALAGAFVAHSSTSMLTNATREQALESKSLYCGGDLDVQKGDRVFDGAFDPPLPEGADRIPGGTTMTGATYTIDGIPPAADTNPWTGWTPDREIPLTRAVG
jgi:hypothetical protein